MRKLLSAFILFSLTFGGIMAQDPAFFVGDKVVNVGIGFGSTYWGSLYSTTVPPLSISYEQGIIDGVLDEGTIGVGGYLGYSSSKYESGWFGSTYGWKISSIIIGARGNFHWPLVDNLDTYTGLTLGVRIVNTKETGTLATGVSYAGAGGGVFGAWHIGGRYFFNDNLAAFAELGYGISYITLGVSFKL